METYLCTLRCPADMHRRAAKSVLNKCVFRYPVERAVLARDHGSRAFHVHLLVPSGCIDGVEDFLLSAGLDWSGPLVHSCKAVWDSNGVNSYLDVQPGRWEIQLPRDYRYAPASGPRGRFLRADNRLAGG